MNHPIQRLVESPLWLRTLLLIAVCAGLIFTGLRSQPAPQFFTQEDKVHHFIGFFALSLSCRLAFLSIQARWIAIFCILVGVLVEYAQNLMPMRTSSVFDALANTLGVIVGLSVVQYCTREPRKK